MTVKRSNASLRFRLSAPEVFLLAVLIPVGLLAVFLIPLGAGHDEETHMERVWEMSAFHFVPNERLGTPEFPYPMTFREVSYRRQLLLRPVPSDFWSSNAGVPIDGRGYFYGQVRTRSNYSPPLLFPQALTMRYLGRRFDLPFLDVYFATRLAGLVSYLLLAWLAVRLMPFAKWTMAILALSPVALLQASTISVDAISQGIGLLYVAGCLAIAGRDQIRLPELSGILALTFLLFVAKPNLAVLGLLPFLLLSPARFARRGWYAAMIFGVASLFCVEVVGWLWIDHRANQAVIAGADPIGQLSYILGAPWAFLRVLAMDLSNNGLAYLDGWVARLGYNYWYVPGPVHLFYLAALTTSLFIRDRTRVPSKRTRIGLALVGFIGYVATVSSLYVLLSPVGSQAISGMHGRYLFPAMAPLWLAITGLVETKGLWSWLAAASCTASLAFFVGGAYLSYHVMCGTSYFRTGLCYQPVFKNWAPQENLSPPMQNSEELVQEIIPECRDVTELRVWVDSTSTSADSRTSIVLRDPKGDIDLVDVVVSPDTLPARGWLRWRFDPQENSLGQLYLLKVRQLGGKAGPRLAFMLDAEYEMGKLYTSEFETPKDLLFQYGCLAGLERLRQNIVR